MGDRRQSLDNQNQKDQTVSLHNRFVELMLIVGLDDNTGLIPDDSDDVQENEYLTSVFDRVFKAQVIAAISASKALIFQPSLFEDPTYPPTEGSTFGSKESFHKQRSLSSDADKYSMTSPRRKHLRHGGSVSAAVIKQRLNHSESANPAKSAADLPLSRDVIEAITTFCFPDGGKVYQNKQDSNIHFLVLTDVTGKKTYTTCITFCRQYWIEKDANGQLSIKLWDPNYSPPPEVQDSVSCFLPQCCVLVSKYPYYYAMKECLSCLISHIERDQEEMFQFIKDFTYTMTMAPVPPAGEVIVEMSVYNFFITIFPPESPERPVVDLPLHLTFLCFQTNELLRIISAILCEERLVFVCYNYALLTIIMESFQYYILPFTWRFTYVPILSASSLELLDAPGTFMMGCNSKHLHVVQQVEGLVIVNIDEGTVEMSSSSTMKTPSSARYHSAEKWNFAVYNNPNSDILSLPSQPVQLFKKICHRSKFQMELSDVERPFNFDINEERTYRMKKCLQFNSEISFACLELMVNLFRGVLPYLKTDLHMFNKAQFLDQLPLEDLAFYTKVLETDMFKQFLEDRMNEKNDYWSDYETRTRVYVKRLSVDTGKGFSQRQQMKPQRRSVSITLFSSLAPRRFETLHLPALKDPLTYSRNVIDKLTSLIKTCGNPSHRSSYVYLRGMFLAAEGNTKHALEDLLSLHSHNSRIMPLSLIQKLLQTVPEGEREEMLQSRGIPLKELCYELDSPRRPAVIDKTFIPDTDLCLDNFVETVSRLEMAIDYDIIIRLFMALSQPIKSTHVDKYTFEAFHLSYEENQSQCEEIKVEEKLLENNETILRVSSLIKSDFGMGRVVLTDKRLFFVKDVSNAYREIIRLREISRLEKLQLHTFFDAKDALVIWDSADKACFSVTLKEERNLWCLLIEEMRAGKLVAEATKDSTAIAQAIQNVLLIDAVVRSGHDESTTHHPHALHAGESLSYFRHYMEDGHHNLPEDTLNALQHRVDPNHHQRERKTVEVMLYTPGSTSDGNSNPTLSARLWCGMGDGKVRVFDATNWTLEDNFVQTRNTVASLVSVGESQVWVGSHGIFIIDTDTVTCNKALMEHPDIVVGIVITQDGRYAFSASVEGTVIQWEIQTLRLVFKFKLTNSSSLKSIKISDNKLYCGTWKGILVFDFKGTCLQTLMAKDPLVAGSKPVDIDCFHIIGNEIWAGCRREGQVFVWNKNTIHMHAPLKMDCRGISIILPFEDMVWIGTKDGMIFIYKTDTKLLWKKIKAHDDAIRSLCAADNRYIMSGSGSKDGKVAIWSPKVEPVD